MLPSKQSLIILIFLCCFFALIIESRITCYDCHSSITLCTEKRPIATCPEEKHYCMFSWNRRTGMAAQGCADIDLCGHPRSRRGLYYPFPPDQQQYEAVPNTDEIINCCNYDYCNCLGGQCKPLLAKAALFEFSLALLVISFCLALISR